MSDDDIQHQPNVGGGDPMWSEYFMDSPLDHSHMSFLWILSSEELLGSLELSPLMKGRSRSSIVWRPIDREELIYKKDEIFQPK